MRRRFAGAVALAALLGACGGEPAAGRSDAADADGARPGAGFSEDAGLTDAAAPDTGLADATVSDAGVSDATLPDALPPDAALPDAPPPLHLDLGRHAPGEEIRFDVPPGYDGLLLQAAGSPGALYAFVDVAGPSGVLVGPDPDTDAPLRTSYNPEVAVALLPNGDAPVAVGPGAWTCRLRADRPSAPLPVEAWLTAGGRSLRVYLFLAPALDHAADDPPVQAMAAALAAQLRDRFDLRAEVEPALLAADAPPELDLDSARGDLSGLSTLAAAAPPGGGDGLDVYLVPQIRDGAHAQGGFTGGLPAPVGLRGTAASVVAVRASLLDDFPDAVADAASHEIGHALGLYHTTEPAGDRHDPIADTPECPAACDADGDGVVYARECGAHGTGAPPCHGASDNLMFWTLGGERGLTDGQRRVVHRHPLTGL